MSEAWISRYKRHSFPKEKVTIINKETQEESTKQKKVIEWVLQKSTYNKSMQLMVPERDTGT